MNSHGRRVFRRQLEKTGKNLPGWLIPSATSKPASAELIVEVEATLAKHVEPLFTAGQVVKLTTDKYGKSYFTKKTKATVINCVMDAVPTVEIQLNGRKSPLTVFANEIELILRD